jgi:hypothetical protein
MMLKVIIAVLLLFEICPSCSKPVVGDKIRYEVTLTGASTWHGSYINANAQIMGITNAPSGWKHEFRNTIGLTVLVLNAYADCMVVGCNALMKIYVNNNLVAEGWSSVTPQVMYVY